MTGEVALHYFFHKTLSCDSQDLPSAQFYRNMKPCILQGLTAHNYISHNAFRIPSALHLGCIWRELLFMPGLVIKIIINF